jgi:hypothetical protein
MVSNLTLPPMREDKAMHPTTAITEEESVVAAADSSSLRHPAETGCAAISDRKTGFHDRDSPRTSRLLRL